MVVRVEDEWDESIVEVVDHLRPHLRHSSGHTGPVAQPVNTRPIKILREKITFLVAVAALGGGVLDSPPLKKIVISNFTRSMVKSGTDFRLSLRNIISPELTLLTKLGEYR